MMVARFLARFPRYDKGCKAVLVTYSDGSCSASNEAGRMKPSGREARRIALTMIFKSSINRVGAKILISQQPHNKK